MKIYLTAFGEKLRSELLEWPEETPMTIRLPLDIPRNVRSMGYGEEIVLNKPMIIIGRFEWDGKWVYFKDGQKARSYVLTGIS